MKLIPVVKFLSIWLFVFSGITSANAQGIITFNNPWINNGISEFSLGYHDGFSFRVTPYPPQPHNNVTHVGAFGPAGYPRNGTPYAAFINTLGIPQYVVFAWTNAATFGDHTFTSGAPFGLISVDLADPVAPSLSPIAITFNGFRADGSTVSQTFTGGGGGSSTFQTFYFNPDFAGGLLRLEIPSPAWAMDNLVWVPEPSTYALLGLGLLAVGARAAFKRRRRTTAPQSPCSTCTFDSMNSGYSMWLIPQVPLLLGAMVNFVVLTDAQAAAPVQFGTATNFPVGGNPRELIVADFNQDGKLDLGVLRLVSTFSVLLGDDDGTFCVRIDSPVGNPYKGLASGDFNNDGQLDVVVGGMYGGSVLLGDGTGSFVCTNFSWWDAYYSVAVGVGDLNGDGRLDLVVGTDRSWAGVTVAFGNGDGTFGSRTNYSIADIPCDIAVVDVNGDRHLDLVVSLRYWLLNSPNSFCALTNKGNGTFGAPVYYPRTPGSSPSLTVRDLNCDGNLDVAVINYYGGGSVEIWLNNGRGAFGLANTYSVGFPPTSIASADFNLDGAFDLIVRGGNYIRVLLGRGDGSFAVDTQMYVPASDSGGPRNIGVGDFNRDSLLDIALTSTNNNSVVIMLNRTGPFLTITPMLGYNQISWHATLGSGYILEWTTNLEDSASWTPFPFPPVWIGNQKAVADWTNADKRFYRLRKAP